MAPNAVSEAPRSAYVVIASASHSTINRVYDAEGREIVYIYAIPSRSRVRPEPDPEFVRPKGVDLSYLYKKRKIRPVLRSVDKSRVHRHRH